MKNIYKTTKGQIITLWVFGVIGFFSALDQAEYSGIASFFAVFIPAFLVFYTIGWRANNKKVDFPQTEKVRQMFVRNKIFTKRIIIIILILVVGITGASYVYDQYSKQNRIKQERNDYLSSYNRYDNYLDNAKKCIQEKTDKLKSVHITDCKQKYDQAHANYVDCKQSMYWLSHNQCINWPNSNYEAIDCSEGIIAKRIEDQYFSECYSDVLREIENINIYEKDIVQDFLQTQMGTRSLVTTSELQTIYSLLPLEVLNDKTRERIQKIIEENGYETYNPFDDLIPKNKTPE